jgi:hypothetical protein
MHIFSNYTGLIFCPDKFGIQGWHFRYWHAIELARVGNLDNVAVRSPRFYYQWLHIIDWMAT